MTTLDNPTLLKIGCFGSVITFSPHLPVCNACPLKDACAKKVFEREPEVSEILRLRETDRGKKDLSEVEAKSYKSAQKYFSQRRTNYLGAGQAKSSRADKDYEAMVAKGVDFTAIARGENPITSYWDMYAYMRVAIDFILAERVFKATDLQERLLTAGVFQTTSTARVYSNRIVSILLLSGQITKEGKVYCLPS